MATALPERPFPRLAAQPGWTRARSIALTIALLAALFSVAGVAWLWAAYGAEVFLALSSAALALCF
jgi:hypothetical protein